ncbi:ATP-binding protein [Streptomyces sp. SID3343]|uniref:ATP-binding protein n=1 Tax=Streptomyces sp. SID3343 TaxID=2690260 RepID=UPI00136E812D|nr:ATP-binding protein [Streptomyces sp. SID3343]MYW01786.1 ATP-binding protein [Streptomyces sp. SID3343]
MQCTPAADGHSFPSLARHLEAARNRAFVGRARELALFRRALAGEAGSLAVLLVHGLAGVGKSSLLRQFAVDARSAGRAVIEIGGRVGSSPAAFELAAAEMFTHDNAVLLVDDFERCQVLECWLRDHFLPRLPVGALTVFAGRRAPAPVWETDPGWAEVVRVVRLEDLSPEDAAALLESRGVPHEPLLAFAGGHPLALALTAEVALQVAPSAGELPAQEVYSKLVEHLVGDLPSAAHRHALEVCSHARATTEELLRAALPGEDAGALFAWLRRLPSVEAGTEGLAPHDVVRNAVDADLRWRDPQCYAAMHGRIRDHLLKRAVEARGVDHTDAVAPIMYLYRGGGFLGDLVTWRNRGEVHEEELRPPDHTAIARMAERAEGPRSATIVRLWLARQPEAFRVYRRPETGEPVGFSAWLTLRDPDEQELRADPVAAAVWSHVQAAGGLRPGEHVGIARFMVSSRPHPWPSPVMDSMVLRIAAQVLLVRGAAWSFVASADPDLRRSAAAHGPFHPTGTDVVVGRHTHRVFGHDWRAEPLECILDHTGPPRNLRPTAESASCAHRAAVMARPEFDEAVREALRCWHRPDALARNPLSRSGLLTDASGSLRDALERAIDTLGGDPRSVKAHRALTVTFVDGAPTQEAAARRVELPFSTYRRHLTLGIRYVSELLWHQAMRSMSPVAPVIARS